MNPGWTSLNVSFVDSVMYADTNLVKVIEGFPPFPLNQVDFHHCYIRLQVVALPCNHTFRKVFQQAFKFEILSLQGMENIPDNDSQSNVLCPFTSLDATGAWQSPLEPATDEFLAISTGSNEESLKGPIEFDFEKDFDGPQVNTNNIEKDELGVTISNDIFTMAQNTPQNICSEILLFDEIARMETPERSLQAMDSTTSMPLHMYQFANFPNEIQHEGQVAFPGETAIHQKVPSDPFPQQPSSDLSSSALVAQAREHTLQHDTAEYFVPKEPLVSEKDFGMLLSSNISPKVSIQKRRRRRRKEIESLENVETVKSCHICTKAFTDVRKGLFCTSVARRRCKKAVCLECIERYEWLPESSRGQRLNLESPPVKFICPHCQGICSQLEWARCFRYTGRRKRQAGVKD